MSGLRLIIADDHEVVRRGVRALLESQAGWSVLEEAGDGREAVEQAKRLRPDVVVLDISMPGLNGFEATRQIRKVSPDSEVLILTMHDSEQVVRDVLLAGARGYVLKSDVGRDLVAAVEALSKHRPFVTSRVAEMVLDRYLRSQTREGTGPALLTTREQEVVQLLAEGKSNKEVAGALGISLKTAETHRANIMRKLRFSSLSDLVRYAIRNKIVEP
ncbi:MAG TPA: response regulator transcription factor [Candidatus Cryosericum sp.]|nr:response regulator transcription factor [Candidatus Cryosericum sp.]